MYTMPVYVWIDKYKEGNSQQKTILHMIYSDNNDKKYLACAECIRVCVDGYSVCGYV